MVGLRISWKFGKTGKFLLHCKMVLSYWISHNFCIIVGSSFSYEISCPVCSLKAKHANNNCFSLQVGTFHHKPTISESDWPSNEHFAVRKVFPHQPSFSCWLFWGPTKYIWCHKLPFLCYTDHVIYQLSCTYLCLKINLIVEVIAWIRCIIWLH